MACQVAFSATSFGLAIGMEANGRTYVGGIDNDHMWQLGGFTSDWTNWGMSESPPCDDTPVGLGLYTSNNPLLGTGIGGVFKLHVETVHRVDRPFSEVQYRLAYIAEGDGGWESYSEFDTVYAPGAALDTGWVDLPPTGGRANLQIVVPLPDAGYLHPTLVVWFRINPLYPNARISKVLAGRLWMGPMVQPEVGAAYSSAVTLTDLTTRQEAESGVYHVGSLKPVRRGLKIVLEDQTKAEFLNDIFGPLYGDIGVTRPFVTVLEPEEPDLFQWEAVYGFLEDATGTATHSVWNRMSSTVNVTESV